VSTPRTKRIRLLLPCTDSRKPFPNAEAHDGGVDHARPNASLNADGARDGMSRASLRLDAGFFASRDHSGDFALI